jgi:HAD superfamily hydrolase (TIGR01509 family)
LIRGLLFDFDGLLVDTEATAHRAWHEIYAEHGHELPLERWLENVGTAGDPFDPLEHLAGLAGPLDRAAIDARRRERELELAHAEELREGVAEYLEEAAERGLAVAIVSSASKRWIRSHLERLGIDRVWACLVTADHDPERAKPAPTLYLEALDTLGLSADEAVAFEDSLNGVRAAKAAGLRCVAVPNPVTAGLALDEADVVVPSLADFPLDALLAKMETV